MDRALDYAVKFGGAYRVAVELEMYEDGSYASFISIGKGDVHILVADDDIATFCAALHEVRHAIPGMAAGLRKATNEKTSTPEEPKSGEAGIIHDIAMTIASQGPDLSKYHTKGWNQCRYCGDEWPLDHPQRLIPKQHDESCIWRRAKEYAERYGGEADNG